MLFEIYFEIRQGMFFSTQSFLNNILSTRNKFSVNFENFLYLCKKNVKHCNCYKLDSKTSETKNL